MLLILLTKVLFQIKLIFDFIYFVYFSLKDIILHNYQVFYFYFSYTILDKLLNISIFFNVYKYPILTYI